MNTGLAQRIGELAEKTPEQLLQWASQTYGSRSAIVTSFQNTGCVMIDMAWRIGAPIPVLTVDTLRLPQETLDLMREIERRYGLRVERFEPDPARLAEMVRTRGEYLFFDSREGQQLCCEVRKVEPNRRALSTVDVWITGVRRDQSSARSNGRKAALVEQQGRHIIKVCPLFDWTEEQVWDYIRVNHVPYNTLYDRGYASIGCIVCSTPSLPGEDKRAGRWRWMNQLQQAHHKECGIHLEGSGI